ALIVTGVQTCALPISVSGTVGFTVLVMDSSSQIASKPLAININLPLSITTFPVLPIADPGTSYYQTLATTGKTAPYTWSILTGRSEERRVGKEGRTRR